MQESVDAAQTAQAAAEAAQTSAETAATTAAEQAEAASASATASATSATEAADSATAAATSQAAVEKMLEQAEAGGIGLPDVSGYDDGFILVTYSGAWAMLDIGGLLVDIAEEEF